MGRTCTKHPACGNAVIINSLLYLDVDSIIDPSNNVHLVVAAFMLQGMSKPCKVGYLHPRLYNNSQYFIGRTFVVIKYYRQSNNRFDLEHSEQFQGAVDCIGVDCIKFNIPQVNNH